MWQNQGEAEKKAFVVRAVEELHMTQHGSKSLESVSCRALNPARHSACLPCLSEEPHAQVPALGPNASVSESRGA